MIFWPLSSSAGKNPAFWAVCCLGSGRPNLSVRTQAQSQQDACLLAPVTQLPHLLLPSLNKAIIENIKNYFSQEAQATGELLFKMKLHIFWDTLRMQVLLKLWIFMGVKTVSPAEWFGGCTSPTLPLYSFSQGQKTWYQLT